MASIDDLLLQRILLHNKFSTASRISECLELQKDEGPDKSLGELMLEKGYITAAQLKLVTNLQTHHDIKMTASPKTDGEKREEALFGKIVLMKKLAREGQIKECLKLQSALKEKEGKYLKLGEILIQKAYLTKYQVEEILKIQQDHKKALLCEVCGASFNIDDHGETVKYRCPNCEIVLTFPKSKV